MTDRTLKFSLKVKSHFVSFRDLSNEAGDLDDAGEFFTSTLIVYIFKLLK